MPITSFPSQEAENIVNNITETVTNSYSEVIDALGSVVTVKAIYTGEKTFYLAASGQNISIGGTVIVGKSVINLQVRGVSESYITPNFVTAEFDSSPTSTTFTLKHYANASTYVRWTIIEYY